VEDALWEESWPAQQRHTDKGRKPDVGRIVVCTMLSIDGYTEGDPR
jgi:hypothetical protein